MVSREDGLELIEVLVYGWDFGSELLAVFPYIFEACIAKLLNLETKDHTS